MQSRRLTTASKKRRGFTLIELLVVISIIATLMSLILPAIQQAREAGRRTQCLNNLRNMTVAIHNYASSNRGRLPALAYFPSEAEYVALGGTPTATGRIEGRSWVVDLLPYLDQQGTFDRWSKIMPWSEATLSNPNTPLGTFNNNLGNDLYVEAFACPNDESAFSVKGGLSYVANSGFGDTAVVVGAVSNQAGARQHSFTVEPFDWDGSGGAAPLDASNITITKATGVFWPEFSGDSLTKNASSTIGKVYDGSSNTLMLGENLKSGAPSSNWADPRTKACGFVLPLAAGPVSLNNAVASVVVTEGAFPNQSKNVGQGDVASLNSGHVGIVVVSFVDGSVRTISEDLDKRIYASLVTPDGTRLRAGIPAEDPLSGDF